MREDKSSTLTRTLIANNPKTAPEAPTETVFLGKTNQETRLAPTPVNKYDSHKPKLPSSSSTSFPVNHRTSRYVFHELWIDMLSRDVVPLFEDSWILTENIQEKEIAGEMVPRISKSKQEGNFSQRKLKRNSKKKA